MQKLSLRNEILDALRILAWDQFSKNQKNVNSELYKLFEEIWYNESLHEMTLAEIEDYIAFPIKELLDFRLHYYQKMESYKQLKKIKINLENLFKT